MSRIFIENLPETLTESEIQSDFSRFGVVTSVQIKERKNVTFRHSSPYFAYIDLDSNNNSLQKCFQYFNENLWHGQRVKLQIAKESFLERLKRERESNQVNEKGNNQPQEGPRLDNGHVGFKRSSSPINSFRYSSTSDDEEEEVGKQNKILPNNNLQTDVEVKQEEESNNIDEPIIIKKNVNKLGTKKLKIESVGNKPLATNEIKQKSLDKIQIEADNKRIGSLLEKKKVYKQQKNAIRAALSYSNIAKMNKIVFNDNDQMEYSKQNVVDKGSSTKPLFDDEDSDEESNNFDIKEKYQGQAGAELLKLQANFKNDKRFVLDSKFLEKDENKDGTLEDDIETEKKKEYEILEGILEHEVRGRNKYSENENERKGMKRFDPSLPDHLKYEMKKEDKKSSGKRKKEAPVNDKKVEDKEIPEVSKEIFYVVEDNLKQSLQEDKGFSLLNLFGHAQDKEESTPQCYETTPLPTKKSLYPSENPFKYDSSDEEDQMKELPKKVESTSRSLNSLKVWSEPFFFQDDDFRLQEGVDFVQRIATEELGDFTEVRRNLKEIARNKVRNNLRKNRPFKKKLGGNKMKKMKRMNKALKR